MNDIQKCRKWLSTELERRYEAEEAEHIAKVLLEECFGVPYPSLVLQGYSVGEVQLLLLRTQLARLLAGEPLQYILGYTDFWGMRIQVALGVLIPRPETEELCYLISSMELLREGDTAVDLCTGSGCIAMAVAQMCTGVSVEAVDVSQQALDIANENISTHHLDGRISLLEGNVLADNFQPHSRCYKLVVSNPPYVLEHERAGMSEHVLEHEPDLALFVPDDDGARFYRAIVEKYAPLLVVGGVVAFEINPLLVDEIVSLLIQAGLRAEVLRDMSGKQRFVFGYKE